MFYIQRFNSFFSQTLFCIVSFLLSIRTVISYSYYDLDIVLNLLAIVIWGSVFIIIFANSYTLRDFLFSLVLFVLGVFIYKNSKSLIPFYTILFLIAAKGKKIESAVKAYFKGMFVSLLFIIGCYSAEIISTSIVDGNSLGFINPNITSFFVTELILLYIFLRYRKISILDFLILIPIVILIGKITGCRTGSVLIFIILLVLFFIKVSRLFRFYICKYIFLGCIFILLFCILGLIFVNINDFFAKANELLSGRFSLAQVYVGIYGIHPFGVDIKDASEQGFGHLVLDMGYFSCLVQFGVVYFTVFIGMYFLLLQQKRKEKEFSSIILIFAVFLGLVSESHWIPIANNIITLLCVQILFSKRHKQNGKFIKLIFKRQ